MRGNLLVGDMVSYASGVAAVKMPAIAGAVVFVGEISAQAAGVGQDLLIETLLALIAALGLYIARETHKHSIFLFGIPGRKDKGVAGDVEDLKAWREEVAAEVEAMREGNEEFLQELREQHNIPAGGHRRPQRHPPKRGHS